MSREFINIEVARDFQLTVLQVPQYSCHSISEHTIALMMCLNRKIHRAYTRTYDLNFDLTGLIGFEVYGKTVGIIGMGKIGRAFAKVCIAMGANVIANDVKEKYAAKEMGVKFVPLDELLASSDIISLHLPYTKSTHHLIGDKEIARMKPGTMLLNTSHVGHLDLTAVIRGLKSKHLDSLGMDVFEGERGVFSENYSEGQTLDREFAQLATFPNVILTGHQAWFTKECVDAIALQTVENVTAYVNNEHLEHQVLPEGARQP